VREDGGKTTEPEIEDRTGSPAEVFRAFLVLGLTSFGGPVAHLGYFEREIVTRRRWISPADFAETLAIAQLLPGPASSQVGMAIGMKRAGVAGSLAAWLGFTLPSAVLMFVFALVVGRSGDLTNAGWLHGLKIAAVAIVAQAVWSMGKNLAPDRIRATFMIATAAILLLWSSPLAQLLGIAAGGVAGWLLFGRGESAANSVDERNTVKTPRLAWAALGAFAALFLLLPFVSGRVGGELLELADIFYRAGALVFGGGHVVLPLLQAELVPDWMTQSEFLAGYGAVQAVPGPLFTFSTYLGAITNGASGALVATVAIFLPSLLLIWGVMPLWSRVRHRIGLQGAIRGINASVVGILLAALYDPIWTSAVYEARDAALVLVLFGSLVFWKAPPWAIVIAAAGAGALFW